MLLCKRRSIKLRCKADPVFLLPVLSKSIERKLDGENFSLNGDLVANFDAILVIIILQFFYQRKLPRSSLKRIFRKSHEIHKAVTTT